MDTHTSGLAEMLRSHRIVNVIPFPLPQGELGRQRLEQGMRVARHVPKNTEEDPKRRCHCLRGKGGLHWIGARKTGSPTPMWETS